MINFKFYLPFADYVKGKVFAYTILIEYNRNKGENFNVFDSWTWKCRKRIR